MPALFGTSEHEEIDRSCVLFSITLTPNVGVDAVLKVYRYTDETDNPLFTFRASGNSSSGQVFHAGIALTGGVTIIATNAESFVVEYA